MNVVIFGASGLTGRHLVRGALDRGHNVTAVVRETSDAGDARARVVRGDVSDRREVRSAIANQDAVISALGARTLAPNALLDRASTAIVAAMQAENVRRVIVLGAAGALREAGAHQSLGSRLFFAIFKATLLRYPMRAQAAQQRNFEASGLDYTIVLPPRLTDGARAGTYRVSADALPPGGRLLSRADLADFMLDQLTDRTFVRATPYVAY